MTVAVVLKSLLRSRCISDLAIRCDEALDKGTPASVKGADLYNYAAIRSNKLELHSVPPNRTIYLLNGISLWDQFTC